MTPEIAHFIRTMRHDTPSRLGSDIGSIQIRIRLLFEVRLSRDEIRAVLDRESAE